MPFEDKVDKVRQRLIQIFKSKQDSSSRRDRNLGNNEKDVVVPWSWVCARLVDLLRKHPSGITEAIIFSELELMWEQSALEYKKGISQRFQTIDSLYETKSVNGNTVFEVMIAGLQLVPGTKTAVMTVQDTVGNAKIAEMYLHQKYYFLLDPEFRCLTDNVQRIIRFHSVRYIETQNTFRFLPSENMIILLTDADQSFISKYFTSAFAEINAPNPGRSQSVQDVNIWAKIVQIGSAHPARVNGRYKKLTITLSDKSGGDTVQFILWDEQIELAGLFKKGDQLGIVQPWVSYNNDPASDGVTLEYGSNTIMFVLPAKIDVISGTGNYVTKDDMGVLDYKFYPERILIKDLQPKMSNLTLFGRIVAMSENMPLSRDGKLMDRYAIRLLDSSGTIDITVWDRLAKLTTSCRLGEYILLTNLTTSERKSGNVIYVNATKALGTEIHRISNLKGVLSTPYFRELSPLSSTYEMDTFYTLVTVSSYSPSLPDEGLTVLAHTACKKPYSTQPDHNCQTISQQSYCTYCKVNVFTHDMLNSEFIYALEFEIDDGTDRLWVEGSWEVCTDLVGTPASEFARLSKARQYSILESIMGKQFIGVVTQLAIDPSYDRNIEGQRYRMDAVLPMESCVGCIARESILGGAR